jgi:hypothetical protein
MISYIHTVAPMKELYHYYYYWIKEFSRKVMRFGSFSTILSLNPFSIVFLLSHARASFPQLHKISETEYDESRPMGDKET